MRRARIFFAGREVEFVDRDVAVKLVEEFAEKGTGYPVVIYGPEGCGKTAFFRQTAEVLREYGYAVVHVNPMAEAIEEKFSVSEELKELARELGAFFLGDASKLIEKAVEVLYTAVRRNIRRRIALLADDVFQAIGVEKAELLVKAFLNMIEWPSIRYERIVIFVASSEGVTRRRVGRHRWVWIFAMWNMFRDGFRQLYEALPNSRPLFDEVWMLTGGNPKMLEELFVANWDVDRVVEMVVESKGLREFVKELDRASRELLEEAIGDPDAIFEKLEEDYARSLRNRLIEKNLLIKVSERLEYLWIDEPPPKKNLDLGIGRFYAWQTPLHREAVRRALKTTLTSV